MRFKKILSGWLTEPVFTGSYVFYVPANYESECHLLKVAPSKDAVVSPSLAVCSECVISKLKYRNGNRCVQDYATVSWYIIVTNEYYLTPGMVLINDVGIY